MFDHVSVPPLLTLRLRILRTYGTSTLSSLLPMGLALTLAMTAALAPASAGNAYAADDNAAVPSIQYQEALAHSSKTYSFAPGDPVTVPYRPRSGDTELVDGAAPVALPAARGTGLGTPNLTVPNSTVNPLRREVLGFLPYWELGSTLNYNTLSTVAYFGVNLNGDGTLAKSGNGWNGWVSASMTSVINDAHAHGTRVALTVESFAWDTGGRATQSAVLGSPTVSLSAAQNIAAEVRSRGVDGVNLDFEPIAPGQYSNFEPFVRMLRTELDKVHAGYEITFCATGAPGTYDLPNLLAAGAADAVFIMAYDLSGNTNAGSIDPLNSTLTNYPLTKVVNTFISQVPASKVILGLPWYGHAWSTGGPQSCTACQAVHALMTNNSTYGSPVSGVTYASAISLATTIGNGEQYDTTEQTAWTLYYGNYGGTADTWRQLYFDDARSLGVKMDAIDGWNLRGLGIWALGYDNNNGNGDLTATVASKLQTSGAPATYVPLAPARILDTRSGIGLSGAFSSHVARTFQVTGQGGVPTGATAVTGNLTVTGAGSLGFLYVGPNAANNPTSSTLNFPRGDDRANSVTVALGAGGTLSVTYAAPTLGPTAHVLFDVTGFFTPDTSGATYHPLTPTRILDTRSGIGLSGAFPSHVARRFQVTGGISGVPSGATAVTGNLTVTQQTNLGYLAIGPLSQDNPTSSTLNFPLNDDRANAATVALDPTGGLSITYAAPLAGKTAQVIFDVTGYFTPDLSGAKYVPLTPGRILDSRDGTGGLSGAFPSHVARTFTVIGHGGVPATATAVTGNLTVTQQTNLGYLAIGPLSQDNPTSSTLNFPLNDDRANAATVALDPTGGLSITYAAPLAGKTAQVIFDVTGYFTPDAG